MPYKPLVNIKNFSIAYLDKNLFEYLSFSVGRGEIVALIGANGCGKTTLLSMIATIYTDESSLASRFDVTVEGDIQLGSLIKLAYLPQKTEKNVHDIGSAIPPEKSGQYEQLKKLFDLEITADKLSGMSDGEKQKLALINSLISDADLYLFDEPTNFLDIAGIVAFEDSVRELCNEGAGVLLVSHDRTLINNLADRTVYITPNGIFQTEGGYSAAWSLAKMDYESREKEAGLIRSRISSLQQEMRTRMGWAAQKEKTKIGAGSGKPHIAKVSAKMAARAKSAQKKAEKEIERLKNTRPFVPKQITLSLPEYEVRNRTVFSLEDVFFDYNQDVSKLRSERSSLLSEVNIGASTEDKLCLMGANGAGKTTLLNLILGKLMLTEGTRQFNRNVKLWYLPQGLAGLFTQDKLLDNFTDTGYNLTDVRKFLGAALIRGDKTEDPITRFSQGELVRAAVVKGILTRSEFLLLDEPTSHLDIESVEILERLLANFPGGYLVISHDRTFVENIADKLYLLEKGRLRMV